MKVIEQSKYNILSTATPTYWPSDPQKTPDLLDFFITHRLSESYLEITASYDLSSDHSPIIATVSETIITKPPPPHLHTRSTNWEKYKEMIQQGTNLNIRLKTPYDIETATKAFITLLQHAAKQATPPPTRDAQSVSIPMELKQLLAEKRIARARWQRTHYPDDKRTYYRLSHKLKMKLKESRERSTHMYINRLGTLAMETHQECETTENSYPPYSQPIHTQ